MVAEMTLLKAMDVVGCLGKTDLSPLSRFVATGKIGGPLKKPEEIPASAWPYLRWDASTADNVLITPEGDRVYDVHLRVFGDGMASAPDLGSSQRVPQVEEASRSASSGQVVHLVPDPFETIVEMGRSSSTPLSAEMYRTVLLKHGVALGDNGGISGASIAEGGNIKISRGGGNGVRLAKAILFTICRLDAGRYCALGSPPAVLSSLLATLREQHPNVPCNPYLSVISPEIRKNLCSEIRRVFGWW